MKERRKEGKRKGEAGKDKDTGEPEQARDLISSSMKLTTRVPLGNAAVPELLFGLASSVRGNQLRVKV